MKPAELARLAPHARLPDEDAGHEERERREHRRAEEGQPELVVLGEHPAGDAHGDRRRVDRRPLDGLEAAGEAEPLAVLDHQRVGEDVRERQPEPHRREQRRDHERCVGVEAAKRKASQGGEP